jgi:hypothetical protein
MLPILRKDERHLRREMLISKFRIGLQNQQRGEMRRILDELLPLMDDPKQKGEYQDALRKVNARQVGWIAKWCLFGTVAIIVQVVAAGHEPTSPDPQ